MRRFTFQKILIIAALFFILQPKDATAYKVRILTFNILNNIEKDSLNPWNNRSTKICIALHHLNATVMGLQEVSPSQMKDLIQGLPGYDTVSIEIPGECKQHDYNPIFYKKDKLKLIDKGFFELSDSPDFLSNNHTLQYPKYVVWASFQDLSTGKAFFIANVHFEKFNTQARLASTMKIKTYLGKLSNNTPIILTGDLNITNTDIAYSTLLTRIFPMKDTWLAKSNKNEITTTYNGMGHINSEEEKRVDYILVSNNIEVKKVVIESTALSDGTFLSDHNILWTELTWK